MNSEKSSESVELSKSTLSGWLMLPVSIALLLGSLGLVFYTIIRGSNYAGLPMWFLITVAVLGTIGSIIMLSGFFTLQPNEARVLILFGEYKGTVRLSGFHWTNPFYSARPQGFVAGADADRRETQSQRQARQPH